jgi:hypothetical protein
VTECAAYIPANIPATSAASVIVSRLSRRARNMHRAPNSMAGVPSASIPAFITTNACVET